MEAGFHGYDPRITGHITSERDTAGSHFQTPWIEPPQRTRLFTESEELLLSCMLVLLLYHLHVSSEHHLVVSIGQKRTIQSSHICRTRNLAIHRHGHQFISPCRRYSRGVFVRNLLSFLFKRIEDTPKRRSQSRIPKRTPFARQGVVRFSTPLQRHHLFSLSLAVIRSGS